MSWAAPEGGTAAAPTRAFAQPPYPALAAPQEKFWWW